VIGDPDSRITFEGPMALMDGTLEEIKVKDIADKPDISGSFRWIGITDRYFMTALITEESASATMKMEKVGDDMIISQLVLAETAIASGEAKTFAYKAFIGPKDTETLKTANYELGEAVNFRDVRFFGQTVSVDHEPDIQGHPELWHRDHHFNPYYQNHIISSWQ
jgi:YidC/Oxa1 family membrane protein insertase